MPANKHLRRFTNAEEREIAQAYLEGWDGPQLAQLFEVKLNLIYRVLKRQNVSR